MQLVHYGLHIICAAFDTERLFSLIIHNTSTFILLYFSVLIQYKYICSNRFDKRIANVQQRFCKNFGNGLFTKGELDVYIT